jgi:asparagine synthase (glutamine-hydrolysing)
MLQAAAASKAVPFKGTEFKHNPPLTDEALWYRGVYEKEYGPMAAGLIPHMWMPQWSPETTDPSARTLEIYASSTA